MAAGAFIAPYKARLNFTNATNILAANTSNFRMALLASTVTLDDANDELWAHVSAHEIAAGNGYTAGGAALSGVTLTQSAGVVTFTASAVVWTASGGYIPAWRYAYIYYLGTLNSKVNPLIAHALANTAPADALATADTKLLTITPHASGIIRFTHA
jgi:hypothetical protein